MKDRDDNPDGRITLDQLLGLLEQAASMAGPNLFVPGFTVEIPDPAGQIAFLRKLIASMSADERARPETISMSRLHAIALAADVPARDVEHFFARYGTLIGQKRRFEPGGPSPDERAGR